MASSHNQSVMSLAREVKGGSLRDREKAVDDLTSLLKARSRNPNLVDLGDKSYHEIFEAIFSFVLREKPSYLDKRKSQAASTAAATRLSKCAAAVRVTVAFAAPKLGRKTLLALIDHITQILPAPNGDFVPPLLNDYVKALALILSRQAHVELLARRDASAWKTCVDFLLDVAMHILPESGDTRAPSVAGGTSSRSRGKPPSSTQALSRLRQIEGGPLRDVLEGLNHLALAPNAPVLRSFEDFAEVALKILQIKQMSPGSIQTLCFSLINAIFTAAQADDHILASQVARRLIPFMSYWWRPEKVSQDELLRSMRNEILKTIHLIHLQLTYLASKPGDDLIASDLEDLSEPLWLEYSRRSENYRLQMVDITLCTSNLPSDYPCLDIFGLRPHNTEGESYWALLQNLANIEAILARSKKTESDPEEDDETPRKRRRTDLHANRILMKLDSREAGVRRTALQLIPFLLSSRAFLESQQAELLPMLLVFAGDKDSVMANWALIACASCVQQSSLAKSHAETWNQAWHLASRLVSLPATSRAAGLLLHAILDAEVLPPEALLDEVNSIVTSADINGPAVLCDSSIELMRHILHARNSRLPNASQSTSHHIIRWLFLRWHPSESAYASFQASHVDEMALATLLEACCGFQAQSTITPAVSGGSIGETWKSQYEVESLNEYLLLLPYRQRGARPCGCPLTVKPGQPIPSPDVGSLFSSKKLILELLQPKLQDLGDLCAEWSKKFSDGGMQISPIRFHSALSACAVVSVLSTTIGQLNSTQSSSILPTAIELSETCLKIALSSVEPIAFVEATLRILGRNIPDFSTANTTKFREERPGLLQLISSVSTALYEREIQQSSRSHQDSMDIDEEFDSQGSRGASTASQDTTPRHINALQMSSETFYTETRRRIKLLQAFYLDPGQIGLIPDAFMDETLLLTDQDVLMSQGLLVELFKSDLVVNPDKALSVIERFGGIISQPEYQCCEVALSACIDIIDSLMLIWQEDQRDLSDCVGDLYNHFVRTCLPSNILSSKAQISMSRFLFNLLKRDPEYASRLGLDSCRTTLLHILRDGPMSVKYYVSGHIADIFELYILMLHDEVFVDVLDSLPKDPESTSGIAFRLLVLSKLACRWPTLLRRCTYHIFETPGKIGFSEPYAARCLSVVSQALGLESPKELFSLFSRQLLYTWLENDGFADIPFSVFAFKSLLDLIQSVEAEAVGLVMMRGQDNALAELRGILGYSESELVQRNFASTLSYSMLYGDTNRSQESQKSDERIKAIIGNRAFVEAINANFVDIVGLYFDLIDQEDDVERVFSKHPDLEYAGEIMKEIKKIAHSPTVLPPNQQPMFRAKYVLHGLFRLCHWTQFQFQDLWTAALVMSVTRRLLNSVHSVLGSLHGCSVLRKVRIVVCLAGSVAADTQALEMLLSSLRAFLVDSECADDAMGISQYLLSEGSANLIQRPSFLAGYGLSTLASLRVFLESSQSSTTQESQFKATMDKAQKFHQWLSDYLHEYKSSYFQNNDQSESFRSIAQAASRTRSSGNADRGSAEGKLLLEILKDGSARVQLLNEASRELAMRLLCSEFSAPISSQDDIIYNDDLAIQYAAAIWKSCGGRAMSNTYLSWAGRTLGRSFSASGKIPEDILREAGRRDAYSLTKNLDGSEAGLLKYLQYLTSDPDSKTAGLAEVALRSAVSHAVYQEDSSLLESCQSSLPEPLFLASQWDFLYPPPSESKPLSFDGGLIWTRDITSSTWAKDLAISVAQSVPQSTLLSVLPQILANVTKSAERMLPWIVHLVLTFQLDHHQELKRSLSTALKAWLSSTATTATENQKLLINVILYLRTQQYPRESSIADRLQWLDLDYAIAASAATRCGMYKTALLFAELATAETTRSSRRSSVNKGIDVNDTLLAVFENIDDPDAYYGLPEEASLFTVLARVEQENDGTTSLAFRGAQYDNNIRMRKGQSNDDAQALVKALNILGLSGLSYSLLEAQQGAENSSSSMESTFRTATRLELWNLPVPASSDHHSIVIYKAFQTIHQATDISVVRSAVHEGQSRIMQSLANGIQNATSIRSRLAALASLTELGDLLSITDSADMARTLQRFEDHCQWMRSGVYEDVSLVLSCRGTSMSMLGQHTSLLQDSKLPVRSWKELEVKSMLLSSEVYRYHKATQESLGISTALTALITPCQELGLGIDAVAKIEAARSLWDHGEIGTSIRMLQGIDKDSNLRHQSIAISRSDLLSKIGYQVSVARLEKPHDIQAKYLEPALKELRGKTDGKDAGLVFHQFATFCDEQLQDPAGLEDLARLQSLKRGKGDEVAELKSLLSSTKDTQQKKRLSHALSKEKQWLDLDDQELRRVEQTRSEFVRLSLENYLLSLIASDDHNNDALRFAALWFERSAETSTNKAVGKHLDRVPTRKFAPLMNQLASRLQNQDNPFQRMLLVLVANICADHPYHGMYQIWSGTKAKAQQRDDVAVQRVKATDKVAQRLAATKHVADTWLAIDKTSKYYHILAMDRNSAKYKSGAKIPIKDSTAGQSLINCLARYRIPVPTRHIELSPTKDYSSVATISKLDPTMSIASGVSAPKIITVIASDGTKHRQLVKGGHDDLRQDAIMEQVFTAVSALLKLHRTTRQRDLGIRTYKVLPLTATSGLIEFVPHTIPLHEFLMPAHERYFPSDMKGSQCRREIYEVQSHSVEKRVQTYRRVTSKFHPVMKYFFMEYFVDPDDWYARRLAYTRSTAAISMLGHVLGLGDRHGHNILLDTKTGEVIHIDLGVAFEAGRILPVPELVPFRLTRDIVDGMGITKTEGVFRRCCEFTLEALREDEYSIMTILDVLRYDPLYTWSISPLRLNKLQKAHNNDEEGGDETEQTEADVRGKKVAGHVNEPSEADRALEVVSKKLSKTLSVTATVNDLINQAMDESNLAVLYSGWAAYA